jgi:hypothetical protein
MVLSPGRATVVPDRVPTIALSGLQIFHPNFLNIKIPTVHGKPARFLKTHSAVRIVKKRIKVPGWSQRGVSSTLSTGLVRAFRKAGSWSAW